MAFNLTAQLNLQGPTNVKQIAAQIKKDLGNINANITFKLDPAVTKNVAALSSSLKGLNAAFGSTTTSATAASAAIKAFGNSINSVKINNVPQQINAAANAVNKLNKASASSAKDLGSASAEMQEFGKQAGLAIRRFVAFSTVTSVIYGLTNSISQGVQAFIDYDKELVKLQQVTGESSSGLAKLQEQITNLSTTFGVSSKDLTSVASTLAQAGLSARETEKALKALALSSLAPSFDDMNETVEGSIALMRQFGISADDLEGALGAVNTVAARFAVESSDIITAVQRTGSVFATASKGVSEGKDALNEFIAVFTSVRATTRESAETIATGLRTIFTRIQRGTTIDALKEFGVNLTDTEGKFVGAYKAVELLSKGLSGIDPRSLQFSKIVEELGGFRQIGKVIPLIQQFTVAQEALKTAQAGQGSLAKDAATAQLSLANQISKVRQEFFALFREIGQSKGFQSLIRGALSLASGLIKVTDAVKGILPALAVITAFKGAKALTQFASGFSTGVKRGPDGKANGGVIRKFARGGVVPGAGSGDTVPAMLEPGEFVIRKKAVETIGADNLHSMNKYGSGGSIRAGKSNKRQKFAKGGPIAAKVDNTTVSDGDTLNVDFTPQDQPFNTLTRLEGWDAFETKDVQGFKIPEWQRKLGRAATQITKGKYNGQNDKALKAFQASNGTMDTYGRPMFKDDDLGRELFNRGLALPYDGRGKAPTKQLSTWGDYKKIFGNAPSQAPGLNEKDNIEQKKAFGGKIQRFMAGGKAESTPFGTGETKFPKRITNAYAKELQKKLDLERVNNAFDPYPTNERITVDPAEVQQKFQSEPFDRKRFLSLFNTKISRNDLVGNLSDFAKFIGLPGEDLSKVLPQTIDFGGQLQTYGYRGKFSRDPFGAQGYDDKGLEPFGFTQADEQDLFGYQKLLDEKTKEIKKILKTPVTTYEDGSFSYDTVAFNKSMDEKMALGKKVSDIMSKKAVARKGLMEQKKGILESTGRGFVSMASNAFDRNQPKNVLYHELTHQLLNSLRTQSEDSFTKYKERVSQLFNGDNDDLADAFDALGGSYNSADVVYGRSYKNGLLDTVLQNLRQETINFGGRGANPELSKEAYSMWVESGQKKNAREYRPINPKINEILLKGGQKQDTIDKVEDYGKEEFLTTLIQNAPKLDSNMQGILDSTLNELLGNAGIQRQTYAAGGKVERKIGIIDTDVLRDPANASIVDKAMEKLGITDVSDYTTKLGELSAKARKTGSLSRLTAIAGAAGSGKSSLATGFSANDDASLRKTIRSQILTPEDIDKVNEVIAITSTASESKLDAYLRDVDRAYILSSNTQSEQEKLRANREQRDATGQGLYGRKPGTTRGADTDFGLEETILRDELGKRATVLGRKSDGFGLRRKKENELPEIIQAGGFYMGGFAPPTRGHRGALDTLLENMLAKNPNASLEDIVVNVATDLPMVVGKEGIDHAARYGIFQEDLRALFSQINFGNAMISTQGQPAGGLSKFMEVAGSGDRRKFAKIKGAMAITSGKDDQVLGKYQRAGIDVKDIPRIEDISATKVRDALFHGDDKTLTSLLHPDIASVLMGNRAQLRNRSTMVPMLIKEIQKFVDQEKIRSNDEVTQILSSAPGGPYGNVSADLKKNYPEIADQVKQIRDKRDRVAKGAFGYRAHNIIKALSAKYPETYGIDPSRKSSVSAQPSDITREVIAAQLSEQMAGEFGGVPTAMPSGLEEAILKNVEKATQVKKSSGILPAQGSEILKRFGDERLPTDSIFGPFSGKTVRDTAEGGKLKYWNSAFRPETKADKLAYYTATRDYLIDKFNESQGTQKATTLAETTNAVLSSKQLGLVGLNPLGYTGLLGPETWNLGVDPSGQTRSIDASIVQRGLPNQYQNVIDYLSGQTEEIVGGASKLLGISPKKLTKKQRETLGQGNIEGALLEQIFGSADATILDDALRTRPIDFPMGIGPKAASIFGIDPDIPTEVKRTIDSGSRGKAVKEFQRYFRQKYGIPEPTEAELQKLASGGKVKLYHGSNTGVDDSVLKSFKEKGALSNIASGYGQGAGFYLYTEKNKAEQQAKMRVGGGSGFTVTSGDTSGKPMVLSFDETLDPKTYDLDYELQKGLVVQWMHDNYDTLKDKYAPTENQTGLKGKFDKNPDAGMMSVGVRVQEGSQTLKSEDGTEFTLPGGSRKSIYAGSEGDVREGALLGQLMSRIQSGDSELVNSFESKLFEKPLGLALKYVGSSPLKPSNIETFAKGGQAGISSQDTVPALLTPGEFVVNKKAAEKIGYGKLETLNKADKLQGYNKGGVVGGGVIQRFATGGSVFSIEEIMKGLKGFAEPAVQKLKTRPETIDSKSIEASSELVNNIKLLTKGFEEAGYSMISFKKVLEQVGAGADISYKDIEKAMTKDVERLKITGASIDTIIAAEKALKNVRDQAKTAVVKRQFLEAGLKESKTGKVLGSGGAQQAILTEAEKKEKLITAQRKSQIEKDLIKKDPSLLGNKDKLERRTNRRLEKEQRQIKEQAFSSATEKVTGIKRSELSGMGIGGADIQSYVSQSMTDRKTLAQMDKQLIAMRLEEYKNAGTVRGVSVKSASEALSLAKEEVSKRREMINEMAKEQGEKGVGAAGFTDIRNSPIKKAVQERYFSGTMSQGIGTALGDVGMVAGLVGGQGKNIANMMYDTSTDEGKIAAAGKGAAIEQAGSTLATGLTTASQLMAINPMLGAAVAIGTALYAASDAVYDFSGAQKTAALEMEKNLRFEEVAASEKDLAKAFKDFEKDLGNIDLQKALDKALVRSSESSLKAVSAETKVAQNEKGKTRTWTEFLSGAEKPKMDTQDFNELDSKIAERNADSGDKAFALISQKINTGASVESIQADKELIGARRALVLADEDALKTVRARIMEEGGYEKVSKEKQDAILDEVANEKILTNVQVQSAIKTKQMSDALEAADKAGRKLAASFEKLSSIISESVNRIKFESDVRKSSAQESRSALRGESQDRGPKLRELNVLENPNAYSEKDFNDALKSATAGVDEKTRNQLIGGAQLQQQLPNAITKSIADKLSTKGSLGVDEAKAEAIKATNEQIDKTNLSDEQKTSLKEQAKTRINNLAEESKKKNDTPKAELDAFREGLGEADNILGAFGVKTLEAVKALSSFKQGALADFSEGLRDASKAAKDAQNYFKKARDIRVQGDMNLREVMTGVGETYDEKQARIMGDVAGLAGGETTVRGIQNRMVDLQAQRTAVEEKRQGISDPNELKKSAEQLRSLDDQLRDTREALDTLASSTELVEKAFDDLKNVRELQKNRESFVNTLLTNTPEEADKLNKTFIRLQRNLSGGLNGAGNQRDARKAFNQTLRETGSVREATKAGNTVLANQRKETLALSQDPGVRAAQELNIRNQYAQGKGQPGVSADQAVADYFKQQQLQLTKSMAIESGMINNPLVQQSLAAIQDPNADPAMKEASDKYLQAVGLQADATKAQGELALLESQQALASANANLKVSIDDLRTTIEASMVNNDMNEGRINAAGQRMVNPGVAVAAPVAARARGGVIYASEGQLVNFQPQGTDTVPAMLTPGEFVINARSTAEHLPLLKAINNGDPIYRSKGGIVYLRSGGLSEANSNSGSSPYTGINNTMIKHSENEINSLQKYIKDLENNQLLFYKPKYQKFGGSSAQEEIRLAIRQLQEQQQIINDITSYGSGNLSERSGSGRDFSYSKSFGASGSGMSAESMSSRGTGSNRNTSEAQLRQNIKDESYKYRQDRRDRGLPNREIYSWGTPYSSGSADPDIKEMDSKYSAHMTLASTRSKNYARGGDREAFMDRAQREADSYMLHERGRKERAEAYGMSYHPNEPEEVLRLRAEREGLVNPSEIRDRIWELQTAQINADYARERDHMKNGGGKPVQRFSKGGLVSYLADGGEAQKRKEERIDAQKESWMMSEATGRRPDEVVSRTSSSWAQSQVGDGRWMGMTEDERQSESKKYEPEFQSRWDNYNNRQNEAQLRSANNAGYSSIKEDPNSGIVGVNFYNEEKKRAIERFEKARDAETVSEQLAQTRNLPAKQQSDKKESYTGADNYFRQQAYLSRFRPEIREGKEKTLLDRGNLIYSDGSSPKGKMFKTEGSRSTQNVAPLILPPPYKEVPNIGSKDSGISLPGIRETDNTSSLPSGAGSTEALTASAYRKSMENRRVEITAEEHRALQAATVETSRQRLEALSLLRAMHSEGLNPQGSQGGTSTTSSSGRPASPTATNTSWRTVDPATASRINQGFTAGTRNPLTEQADRGLVPLPRDTSVMDAAVQEIDRSTDPAKKMKDLATYGALKKEEDRYNEIREEAQVQDAQKKWEKTFQTATSSNDARRKNEANNIIEGSKRGIEKRAQIVAQEAQFDSEFNQLLESGAWRDDEGNRESYKKQRREQVIKERNQSKLDAQTAEIDNKFNKFLAEGKVKENQREQYRTEQRQYMPKPYMESVANYRVPTAKQLEEDKANSVVIAQFEGAQQVTAAEKVRAQQQKAEEDRQASLWINSSNPATAAAGYVGGVTQGIGDALYGAANITAGAVATVASPIVGGIGYAMSGDDTAFKIGDENNLRNRTAENMYDEARANGRPMPSPQEIAAAQDVAAIRARAATANSDRLNNQQGTYSAATSAAADVGLRAMGAGAMSFVEAGQAVAGMGPIQNGTETALQRNDARNVELAGGMDSYLGFATAGFQTAGYASSQAVGALINAEGAVTNVAGRAISSGARMAGRVVPGAAGAGRVAGRVAGTVDRAITGTARGAGRLGGRIPGASGAGRAVNNFVEGVQDVATQMGDVIGVRGITPNYSRPNLNRSNATSPFKDMAPAKPVTFAESAPTKIRSIDDINPLEYDGNYGRLAAKAKAARSRALDEKLSNIDLTMPTPIPQVKPKITAAQYQQIQDLIDQGVPNSTATQSVLGKAKTTVAGPVIAKPKPVSVPQKPVVVTPERPPVTASQTAPATTSPTPTKPLKPAIVEKPTFDPDELIFGDIVLPDEPTKPAKNDWDYIGPGDPDPWIGGPGSGDLYPWSGAQEAVPKAAKKPGFGSRLGTNVRAAGARVKAAIADAMTVAKEKVTAARSGLFKRKPVYIADPPVTPSPAADDGFFGPTEQRVFYDPKTGRWTTEYYTKGAAADAGERAREQAAARAARKPGFVSRSGTRVKAAVRDTMDTVNAARSGLSKSFKNMKSRITGTVDVTDPVSFRQVQENLASDLADYATPSRRDKFLSEFVEKSTPQSVSVDPKALAEARQKHAKTLGPAKTIPGGMVTQDDKMVFRDVNAKRDIVQHELAHSFQTKTIGMKADPFGGKKLQLSGLMKQIESFVDDPKGLAAITGGKGYSASQIKKAPYELLSTLMQHIDKVKGNKRAESILKQLMKFHGYSNGGLVRYYGNGGHVDDRGYTESPEYKAAERERQIQDVPKPAGGRMMYASGGLVYANNGALVPSLAQGTDTVPAMLTPGEFVVNRESSQQHMPLLNAINSGHFNRGGIVNYLANGGIVAPKYYAEAGLVSGGSGGGSGVSNDISSSISAAVGQAMNQLSTALESGMETYSQMMQSSTETLNNFGQTFSSASQTIASSANTWSETASQIPTSLTAEVTGRQVVDFTGLGKEGDRIVSSAAQAGQLAGSQTSQNTMAKYDRAQFEGNLNTAANNRPMRT